MWITGSAYVTLLKLSCLNHFNFQYIALNQTAPPMTISRSEYMKLVKKQTEGSQTNLLKRNLENRHMEDQEATVQQLNCQSVLDTSIRELQNVESYVSYFRELFQFTKLIFAPVPKHHKNDLLTL
jgi:hypothetical protein